MTHDEKHVYIYNEYVGLIKIGCISDISTNKGITYVKNTSETNGERVILYLNNKLFVRSTSEEYIPFKIYDKFSLEHIEDEEYKVNIFFFINLTLFLEKCKTLQKRFCKR
jgi:hypothetical protein